VHLAKAAVLTRFLENSGKRRQFPVATLRSSGKPPANSPTEPNRPRGCFDQISSEARVLSKGREWNRCSETFLPIVCNSASGSGRQTSSDSESGRQSDEDTFGCTLVVSSGDGSGSSPVWIRQRLVRHPKNGCPTDREMALSISLMLPLRSHVPSRRTYAPIRHRPRMATLRRIPSESMGWFHPSESVPTSGPGPCPDSLGECHPTSRVPASVIRRLRVDWVILSMTSHQ